MMRRSILTPLLVALIAFASGGWFLQKGVSEDRNVYSMVRLFDEVLHYVSNRFVDAKDPSQLYEMAIDGLLTELGDPHSSLMDPREYGELQVQTRGEYGGLGIQIGVRDGWVTVIAPLPGTPAERAGLMAGDKIVEVDGESTRGWTENQAVSVLRGPKGKAVDLGVARVGTEEAIPFRVVRDEIHVSSVPAAYMLDDAVGYVELTVFSESSTDEVRAKVRELRDQGARGLILDLRGNPGGLLDQSIGLADLFLPRGATVAETKGRTGEDNRRYPARSQDQFPDMPLVVLVGTQSASASEIMAGALQDHDRALVIGQRTFGKGSVQTLFPLKTSGYFLKLTTSRWYTPAGRSIQGPYGVGEQETVMDVAEAERADSPPVYRTAGGRTVIGGGGIHPDLLIGDSLSTGEQAFVRAVARFGSAYQDALHTYAFEFVHENANLRPDFQVTERMLDRMFERLQSAGVEIERGIFGDASGWIARQLGYRIAYTRWNQEEARKRWNREDAQVAAARDLIRESESPRAIFNVADRYAETHEGVRSTSAVLASGELEAARIHP